MGELVKGLADEVIAIRERAEAAEAALRAHEAVWEHAEGCMAGCEPEAGDWCEVARDLSREADVLRRKVLAASPKSAKKGEVLMSGILLYGRYCLTCDSRYCRLYRQGWQRTLSPFVGWEEDPWDGGILYDGSKDPALLRGMPKQPKKSEVLHEFVVATILAGVYPKE